jgi:plastocyanin
MLCILVMFSALPGSAAELRGTVVMQGSERKAPARYVVAGAAPAAATEPAGLAAVILEPLDFKVTSILPDTPLVMAQQGMKFVPTLLVVPRGAEVTFPNRDAVFHNVFSYSPPESFDLGRYPQGDTRTLTFDQSGIVRVFCEIHASMQATIVVVDSDIYTVVTQGEEFVFSDLAPGRYRVRAVDRRGRRTESEIALTESSPAHLVLTVE